MMKLRYLLLLATLFALVQSCGIDPKDRDEKMIEKTVNEFYTNINEKDFEAIKKQSTQRMHKFIDFFKNFGDDLVVYKSHSIDSMHIDHNHAEVFVTAVDIFDNRVEFRWELHRSDEEWQLDMFYGSDDSDILTEEDYEYTKIEIEDVE